MSGTRDELVFMARTAEKCKRYDDMTEYMTRVVSFEPHTLNEEERSSLATAFKQAISTPRQAWKIVKATLNEAQTPDMANEINNYLGTIDAKIRQYCSTVIELLKDRLIPYAVDAEEKVFYHKMHGDYYRYLSEVCRPDELEHIKKEALAAYNHGEEAGRALPPANATSLSLTLNMAVFYHEVCKNQGEAIKVTTAAIAQLKSLETGMPEDVVEIYGLMEDNLSLWTQGTHDGTVAEDL
eukprot:TRINITY_DN123454_c0_g1_i1.p1 TRINITY_DN123454_c0_g1~~TRINITY_DN123454_c0_g1_i1.p1  ORF type:complete len:239 (+),score=65.61 TRINITY_DN123454_c0_g1_i1:100-816(+)